jgi:TRAP-type C4-dicarboxylate transport system permease large subunit
MFMDSLSMILLFMPIFWPIMLELDFGMVMVDLRIWFSIITLMVVEMGLITPPIGLNVFVINSMAGDVPMRETFRGVIPFLLSDVVRVGLLIVFPSLVLILPKLLS